MATLKSREDLFLEIMSRSEWLESLGIITRAEIRRKLKYLGTRSQAELAVALKDIDNVVYDLEFGDVTNRTARTGYFRSASRSEYDSEFEQLYKDNLDDSKEVSDEELQAYWTNVGLKMEDFTWDRF